MKSPRNQRYQKKKKREGKVYLTGFTHTPKKTKTPRREMKRVTKKKKKEKTTHRASQTGTAQHSFQRRDAATERSSETRGHPETRRCKLHNPKTGPGIKNAGLEAGPCSQQQMQASLASRGASRVAAPPSGKTDPLKPSTPMRHCGGRKWHGTKRCRPSQVVSWGRGGKQGGRQSETA